MLVYHAMLYTQKPVPKLIPSPLSSHSHYPLVRDVSCPVAEYSILFSFISHNNLQPPSQLASLPALNNKDSYKDSPPLPLSLTTARLYARWFTLSTLFSHVWQAHGARATILSTHRHHRPSGRFGGGHPTEHKRKPNPKPTTNPFPPSHPGWVWEELKAPKPHPPFQNQTGGGHFACAMRTTPFAHTHTRAHGTQIPIFFR